MNIIKEDTKYCVVYRLLYIIWENGSRDREVFLKIRKRKEIRKITSLIFIENYTLNVNIIKRIEYKIG